jgi:hypothetical protein
MNVQESLNSSEQTLAGEVIHNFENRDEGARTRLDSLVRDIEEVEECIWTADFLDAIELIATLETSLQTLTAACVAGARAAGERWADIGDALGVRLQTAWERYRHLTEGSADDALAAVREVEARAESQRTLAKQILAANADLLASLTPQEQARVRRDMVPDGRVAKSMRATLRREGAVVDPVESPTLKSTRRAKAGAKK